ncbi:MAG: phosphate ABC transporter substrate-binding protein [Eubacteriales bacterium]|nr:phosphate ABC transporter substrate-binding protein [Eubacteriales bacterium]
MNREKIKKILAWICIAVIFGLVIALIVCSFTHQSTGVILSLLFCLMVVPAVFYIILNYIKKTTHTDAED